MNGINDFDNKPLIGDNDLEIRALVGDANQDRIVSQPDTRLVRAHAGEVLDQTNFLLDLDLDDTIGLGDSQVVTLNRGHTVP